MIRFLQFSDIHFLFCEETEDDYAQMRIRFIEDLENVKRNLGAIDYILICGDIANKGQKEEFNRAKKFIETVSNALEIDGKRPNIFVVPGNHDINRKFYEETRNLLRPKLLDKDGDSFLRLIKHSEPDTLKILYSPLTAYNEFAEPYLVDEISETIMIGDKLCFDNKNYYWKFNLGKEGDYNVNLYTRVRDNILKSKEQKNIQPTKGGHKMVTCQNYVSLFYRQITSCPSDGGIS